MKNEQVIWTGTHPAVQYKSLKSLLDDRVNSKKQGDFNIVVGSKSVCFTVKDLPYCCGIYEVGNLSSSVLNHQDMDQIFIHILKCDITYIINTIDDVEAWSDWLSDSELFREVKTFENPNTGNDVTIWISK